MWAKRESTLWVALGATVGLSLGGITAYWWLNHQRPLATKLPTASDIVPQDALALLEVSTDAQQWQALKQFGSPDSRKLLDQQVQQWRDRFLPSSSADAPPNLSWVGDELALAYVPVEETSVEGTPIPALSQQPSPVLFLPIRRVEQAQAALSSATQGITEEATEDYNGTQIRTLRDADRSVFFLALVNNQIVVVSSSEAAIKRVVDTANGEPSLARSAGFRSAFDTIFNPEPLARLYINAAATKELATNYSITPVPLWGLTPLQNNQGIAATAALQGDRLQIHGMNWLPNNSKLRYAVKNSADQFPALLPDQTLLMASSGHLKEFWQAYHAQFAGDADPSTVSDPLQKAITNIAGLDLEADLLNWMEGEFAFGIVANPAEGATPTPTSLVALSQATDRTMADQALTKLDQSMQQRDRFSVTSEQVGGQSVVKWVSPFQSVTALRGWLDDDIAFLTAGLGGSAPVALPPTQGLASNELYRRATESSLEGNNGHFYAQVEQLFSGRYSVPLPQLPPNQAAVVQSIRAIGVTAAIQSDRSTRYDISVLLKAAPTTESAPASPPAN